MFLLAKNVNKQEVWKGKLLNEYDDDDDDDDDESGLRSVLRSVVVSTTF